MSDPSALVDEALRLISSTHAFAALPTSERARLAAWAREMRVTPGELVVREGDRGDRMYFIASGSVQVLGRAFEGSDLVLARLEAGQYFGEQALLASGTLLRNASVRAITNCRLLVLTQEDLLAALDENSEFVRRLREASENQKVLRRSQLREQVLRNLGASESYRIETYQSGQWVFRQGESGDRLYLILGGSAQAIRHEQEGVHVMLAELLPGQFFGELAILNNAPRAASVQATSDLEVASLDGAWFRSALTTHPQLRSLMTSLETMYMLPSRGVLTLQAGNLGTQPTLTAVHHFPDGRRVVSTRLVGVAAFTVRLVGATEATKSARYVNANRGVIREIHVADGRIVELESEGDWPELGDVLELLLDGTPIDDSLVATFGKHGNFNVGTVPIRKATEVVCQCSSVSSQQILQAIEEGCHSLRDVANKTKATLVCGGCRPYVRELLGEADWTPARCESVTRLSDNIWAFRIRPLTGDYRPNLAGQHLVIRARVDNHWIQRPYTISSSADASGTYEITVKREPDGVLSRWLFDRLRAKTFIRISEPSGNYFLPADQTTDVVCLVGGIGITPALAMARTLSADPRPFRFHIDYSVSREEDVICREEIEGLPLANPNCKVRIRVTQRDGRISANDIATLTHHYPDAAFYLCASQTYMETVGRYLTDAKIPASQIRVEIFTVAGARL